MFWFSKRNRNFCSEASKHLGIPLRHYLPGLHCALDKATAAPSCGQRRVKRCPGLLWEHRKEFNNSQFFGLLYFRAEEIAKPTLQEVNMPAGDVDLWFLGSLLCALPEVRGGQIICLIEREILWHQLQENHTHHLRHPCSSTLAWIKTRFLFGPWFSTLVIFSIKSLPVNTIQWQAEMWLLAAWVGST